MRYVLLIAALAAGIAGYTIYWHVLAGRMDAATERWIADREAEGYAVSYSSRDTTGFPGRLVLTFGKPHFGRTGEGGHWESEAERLTVYIQPWDLGHVILDFGHTGDIAWTANGRRHDAHVSANRMLASLILSGGKLERLAADGSGVTIAGTDLSRPLTAGRLQLHERANRGEDRSRPPDSLDLAVQADALQVPPEYAGPLGDTIASLDVNAMLPAPQPRGVDQIAAWRDDGGSIELNSFLVKWGPLDVRGSGTLALDNEMRPLAAMATEIRGFAPTVDALASAGRIRANDARTAKIALGLLSQSDGNGAAVLKVPVSAQDGRLYVGPVPLLRLAPLPFPNAVPPAAASSASSSSASSTSPASASQPPVSQSEAVPSLLPAPSGQSPALTPPALRQ